MSIFVLPEPHSERDQIAHDMLTLPIEKAEELVLPDELPATPEGALVMKIKIEETK